MGCVAIAIRFAYAREDASIPSKPFDGGHVVRFRRSISSRSALKNGMSANWSGRTLSQSTPSGCGCATRRDQLKLGGDEMQRRVVASMTTSELATTWDE
jgi:hypothetical protein